MSLVACPFCDFVTKNAGRSDNVRRHVQRKHPSGGALTFTDNGGYHMIHPTTEIFLKVKDVNGSEKYGDAFCVDCYSWLGLEPTHVRQSNRVSRCQEHVCKIKQERKARTPGAKSTPKTKMGYEDFTKAGLGKYIEFNEASDFDLATTLANIHAALTKPSLLDTIIRTNPLKYKAYMEDLMKKLEQEAIDYCEEGETPGKVTDECILRQVLTDAVSVQRKKVVPVPAKLDSSGTIEHVQ